MSLLRKGPTRSTILQQRKQLSWIQNLIIFHTFAAYKMTWTYTISHRWNKLDGAAYISFWLNNMSGRFSASPCSPTLTSDYPRVERHRGMSKISIHQTRLACSESDTPRLRGVQIHQLSLKRWDKAHMLMKALLSPICMGFTFTTLKRSSTSTLSHNIGLHWFWSRIYTFSLSASKIVEGRKTSTR